ncbi:hypothetical protein MHYP_G00266420 [Metynnis hypsauchen]
MEGGAVWYNLTMNPEMDVPTPSSNANALHADEAPYAYQRRPFPTSVQFTGLDPGLAAFQERSQKPALIRLRLPWTYASLNHTMCSPLRHPAQMHAQGFPKRWGSAGLKPNAIIRPNQIHARCAEPLCSSCSSLRSGRRITDAAVITGFRTEER